VVSGSSLKPKSAFCLQASIVVWFLAGSSASTSLYSIYKAPMQFSSTALMAIFAVYAIGVLVSLLIVGRLSDFRSKEDLVCAYLALRDERRRASILSRIEHAGTPRHKILAVFDSLGETIGRPGFRGCAFSRAEAGVRRGGKVHERCEQARGWLRSLLESLAQQAGASDPSQLALALTLLYDGTSMAARFGAEPSVARAGRHAVDVLLRQSVASASELETSH